MTVGISNSAVPAVDPLPNAGSGRDDREGNGNEA
jgi:hypothetical protein